MTTRWIKASKVTFHGNELPKTLGYEKNLLKFNGVTGCTHIFTTTAILHNRPEVTGCLEFRIAKDQVHHVYIRQKTSDEGVKLVISYAAVKEYFTITTSYENITYWSMHLARFFTAKIRKINATTYFLLVGAHTGKYDDPKEVRANAAALDRFFNSVDVPPQLVDSNGCEFVQFCTLRPNDPPELSQIANDASTSKEDNDPVTKPSSEDDEPLKKKPHLTL